MATTSASPPVQDAGANKPSDSELLAGQTSHEGNSAAPEVTGQQTVTIPTQPSALSQPPPNEPPVAAGPGYEIASFQPIRPADDPTTSTLKDGRVRNPVPSKLKGKTDQRKGNFAVMHMAVSRRDIALERDAAAKRTSESTAMAAKMAFQNGYVPLRRSRFQAVPDEVAYQTNPMAPGAPPLPQQPIHQRPLDSADIKAEQARLLTLLRSISPHLVVDQICKALAFFGGIPSAPPPADGRFPESERLNGSGALFVGWIAEIFPNLSGPRIPDPNRPSAAPVYHAPREAAALSERRPRGRPKGSKASKFRSDKGLRKGPIPRRHFVDMTNGRPQERGDDSWIDVNDGDEEEHPEIAATPRKRGRPKGSKNRPKDGEERERGSAPIVTPIPESGLFSIGRKKGRPKGSKNKPREFAVRPSSDAIVIDDDDEEEDQDEDEEEVSTNQPGISAVHGAAPPAGPTSFQPVNTEVSNSQPAPAVANTPTSKKRKRKGKDAETAQGSTPSNGPLSSQTNGTRKTNNASIGNRVSQTPIPIPIIPPMPAPPPAKRQRKSKEPASSASLQATTPSTETTQAGIGTEDANQPERYTSPTIEELEAQLEEHANFSPPPAPAAVATPVSPPRSQQAQQRSEQRQTPAIRPQRVKQHQTASPLLSSVQSASPNLGHSHSASPNMSHQQMSNSHTPNSVTPQPQQQQSRTSQPFYTQNRGNQPQFSQQSQQQQGGQTQQYNTQPQKSQFTQQSQQTYSPQQQPQYSSQQNKQQSYTSQQTTQRYPSQQQQYSTYGTSSGNNTPQTLSQQSPQFGNTTNSSFNSGDSNYRTGSTTGMNYGNSSFGSLRTTTASPSDNTYRGAAQNYGTSTRQSSSYSGGGGRTPLPSSTAGHSSVQGGGGGVQSLPSNMQGFQNFTDLSSFDMSNLDGSGSSGLGLNTASYNMGGGGNVSRGPSSGASYATSAMANFDTNLGGNDRYYVGRR